MPVSMFTMKTERLNSCETSVDEAEADHDREQRHQDRDQPGDDRAEDEQQDHERGRQPEVELAVPRSLDERVLKSFPTGGQPVTATGKSARSFAAHRVHHRFDIGVGRGAQVDQCRVAVGGDQRAARGSDPAGDARSRRAHLDLGREEVHERAQSRDRDTGGPELTTITSVGCRPAVPTRARPYRASARRLRRPTTCPVVVSPCSAVPTRMTETTTAIPQMARVRHGRRTLAAASLSVRPPGRGSGRACGPAPFRWRPGRCRGPGCGLLSSSPLMSSPNSSSPLMSSP